MSGDALAELLRILVEQQQAEDAAARAAWKLSEAEEADPAQPAEVARARERYEAAVAAVEAARARRREIEAQLDPRDVDRAHAMLAGGGPGRAGRPPPRGGAPRAPGSGPGRAPRPAPGPPPP